MAKSVEDMAKEAYQGNPDLAKAVVKEVRRLGHAERIEKGELHLPSPQDAEVWFTDPSAGKLPT